MLGGIGVPFMRKSMKSACNALLVCVSGFGLEGYIWLADWHGGEREEDSR